MKYYVIVHNSLKDPEDTDGMYCQGVLVKVVNLLLSPEVDVSNIYKAVFRSGKYETFNCEENNAMLETWKYIGSKYQYFADTGLIDSEQKFKGTSINVFSIISIFDRKYIYEIGGTDEWPRFADSVEDLRKIFLIEKEAIIQNIIE